jgi:hypothetical protein
MKLKFLERPTKEWTRRITKSKQYPRHWIVTTDLEITLSDGYLLKIPRGTIWDGASIPSWLWWLFKPIDKGAIGDLIHDELWRQKEGQLKHFNYSIYKARYFADRERLLWRNALAPNKKIKNITTHLVIRLLGGLFYSRQLKIPN